MWTDSCSRRRPCCSEEELGHIPYVWYWGWRSAQLVNSPVSLWVQVWHQPREYYPVWPEHRDRSHRGPGIALRVCRRGSALSSDVRHESGLPRHQENLLLRRFPQVSVSTLCPRLTSDLFTVLVTFRICSSLLVSVEHVEPSFPCVFPVAFTTLLGRYGSE